MAGGLKTEYLKSVQESPIESNEPIIDILTLDGTQKRSVIALQETDNLRLFELCSVRVS